MNELIINRANNGSSLNLITYSTIIKLFIDYFKYASKTLFISWTFI